MLCVWHTTTERLYSNFDINTQYYSIAKQEWNELRMCVKILYIMNIVLVYSKGLRFEFPYTYIYVYISMIYTKQKKKKKTLIPLQYSSYRTMLCSFYFILRHTKKWIDCVKIQMQIILHEYVDGLNIIRECTEITIQSSHSLRRELKKKTRIRFFMLQSIFAPWDGPLMPIYICIYTVCILDYYFWWDSRCTQLHPQMDSSSSGLFRYHFFFRIMSRILF